MWILNSLIRTLAQYMKGRNAVESNFKLKNGVNEKNRNDNKKRLKGGEKYGDKGKTSKMENWIVKMETKQCSKLNQRLTQGRK